MRILRWICEKCNKKWIYPIDRCIYCKGNIKKIVGKKAKVVGITKVSIPSPLHPIIPYNILILEDENGNRMPKKTIKDYNIGDEYADIPSKDKSSVSIVKIKYDISEAVDEALELISGIGVNQNSKVLIKPNIMADAYSYFGITTNPKVVSGIIEYLLNKGVKKENITIAERVQFGEPEKTFAKTGFLDILKKYGVKVIDLDKSEFAEKNIDGIKYEIAKEIFEHDLIINVPVLKTHMMLGIAGALENLTRIVSKSKYDEIVKKSPEEIAKAIALLPKALPNMVVVGDGTIAMQGNGPGQYGEPAFFNLIFASKDAVAHDKIFQEMCLLKKAPYIELAGQLGVGETDIREIEVIGNELDALKRDIKPPIGSKLIK